MPSIGEIAVNLVARTSGLESGLKRGQSALAAFGDSARRSAGMLAGMVGIAGGFGGLGFAAKLAADAEQAKVAINTMTGSLEVTKRLLAEINTFSTVTPFEPTELREAAQSLLAFNFSTGEVMGTLKTLGDISAGTGRRLIEFVQIVGKVRDRGKLTAETLNEFGLRAASVMEPLARVLGVTREEVTKLASAGKISFNDLMKALEMMTSEGGLYFDAMQKQSETLAGRWSTLTGNVKLLAENIGAVLLPTLGMFVDVGNRLMGFLLTFDKSTVKFGLSMAAGALAISFMGRVIPQLVAGFRMWNQVLNATIIRQTALAALQGPKGWAAIAAAILATTAAAGAFYYILGDVSDEAAKVADTMERTAKGAKQAADEFVRIAKLRPTAQQSLAQQLAEADRRVVALGGMPLEPRVQVRARSILGGSDAGASSVLDEVTKSNALLTQIETNTREGGVEVREADL